MTGNEIAAKLVTALKAALPDAEIRTEFAENAGRKSAKPVICIGVLKEKRTAGICTAELGFWLYVRKADETAPLFEAVCAAMDGLSCAILSISREEMRYDSTLGCLVTVCRAEVESAVSVQNVKEMRFGNFVFLSLPETLEVRRQGNVQETATVSGRTKAGYTGGGRRKVTGKGVFFDADAQRYYAELEEKFGSEDTLFLPGMAPFPAILSKLAVTETITGEAVRFDFGFEEVTEQENGLSGRTYLAHSGESLWDYADMAGFSVEELVKANPQIVCINELKEGEEVYIP